MSEPAKPPPKPPWPVGAGDRLVPEEPEEDPNGAEPTEEAPADAASGKPL